jgi:MscS family membrane protein
MNDFLSQVFLDNTVKSYGIVSGIILFVWLLKRFISRYLANLIYRGVKKIWSDVDKNSFSGLVAQPLGLFLLILVSIISLHKLRFPSLFDVEVYKYTTREIIHTAGTVILICSFIWLLLRIIDFIAMLLEKKADLTTDQSDNQLIVFFKDFLKVGVGIVGVIMILKIGFGFSVGSFITGLSIATAAIALATRESLENLIASFIIFFDKPFTIGDLVKIQHITGTVEKIGLRSTRIRTDQKTFVTVPNKQMVDSILDNLSLRTQRKAEIQLELGVNVSSTALQNFIDGVKAILVHPQIEEGSVFLHDVKPNAFLVHADFFTAPVSISEFNKLKQERTLSILQLMEEMKIELAGASSEIKISGRLG